MNQKEFVKLSKSLHLSRLAAASRDVEKARVYRDKEICEAVGDGVSAADVAKAVGMTSQRIYQILRQS